jgi:hypothetical protein
MVPTTAATLRLTAPDAAARPVARARARRPTDADRRLAGCLGAAALLLALALALVVAFHVIGQVAAASDCVLSLDDCLLRWRDSYGVSRHSSVVGR